MNREAILLRTQWQAAPRVLRETALGDGAVGKADRVAAEPPRKDLPARARLARFAASAKATQDLGDFIVATVLEAFLQLEGGDKAFAACVESVLGEPIDFVTGFLDGWTAGVEDAITAELKSWLEIVLDLRHLWREFKDIYADYLDAVTDPSLILGLVITLIASSDRSFDETVARLLKKVGKDHSELAAVISWMLEAVNQISGLRLLLEQVRDERIARALVSELGKLLRDHWQEDLNRYLEFRDEPEGLGFALGFDYGRLGAEIALMVVV